MTKSEIKVELNRLVIELDKADPGDTDHLKHTLYVRLRARLFELSTNSDFLPASGVIPEMRAKDIAEKLQYIKDGLAELSVVE